jgi:hypothetical protein
MMRLFILAERMENKLVLERATHLKTKLPDADVKPTEYRWVHRAMLFCCSAVVSIWCIMLAVQANRRPVYRNYEEVFDTYTAVVGGSQCP